MRWVRNKRASGLIEWVDESGCGHPDQASVDYLNSRGHNSEDPPLTYYGIHGCTGACARDDFPGHYKNMVFLNIFKHSYRLYTTGDLFCETRGRWVTVTPTGFYLLFRNDKVVRMKIKSLMKLANKE